MVCVFDGKSTKPFFYIPKIIFNIVIIKISKI